MNRKTREDYDDETTARCERVLLTLLGDLGPWRERLYLVGGLTPRYLIGQLPKGVAPHVGTTDVDLVIGLALGDDAPETYRTLQNNLAKSGFKRGIPSFRWAREVEGISVIVEFLCETEEVPSGQIYQPKGEQLGAKVSAFNVRGAHLVRDDYFEHVLEGERLDGGGQSRVALRVADVLSYVTLKILAFQDRHENKDSYDLVFTLLNYAGGPREAGRRAAGSDVAEHPHVAEALTLLADRYADAGHDGPSAYATFLAIPGDETGHARLRQQAVATIVEFLNGFNNARKTAQ